MDESETLCGLCGEEVENLGHFVLRCNELNEMDVALVERMRRESEDEILGVLLFGGEVVREVGIMIYRLWGERSSRMEIIEGGRDSA